MTALRHRVPAGEVPRGQTVLALLAAFQAAQPAEELGALCDAVELFFNRVLGLMLLYPVERPLYQRAMATHPTKTAAQVYGATHLLRLLVRLPDLLQETPLPRASSEHIERGLALLSRFISTHAEDYFTTDYAEMTMDYVEDATIELGANVDEV